MLRIELPLPAKVLHPNASKPASRAGMIGLNKAKKKARRDAYFASLYAIGQVTGMSAPRWNKATVKATFTFQKITGRGHDQDNLIAWTKHLIDGICDAGVLVDDSGLTWLPSVVKKGARPGVVLEIEPRSET